MIERALHRIWLGPARIPEAFEAYWGSFREMHPDWSFTTWRDADLQWLVNAEQFRTSRTASEASDVARYEILAREGGFYVDTDVEPLATFEPLRCLGAVAGWEQPNRICGAVLGAEANHAAVQVLIDRLPLWVRKHPRADAVHRAGPAYLTRFWQGRDDVSVLHREAFFPVHWSENGDEANVPNTSYARHHWAHSWAPK